VALLPAAAGSQDQDHDQDNELFKYALKTYYVFSQSALN